MIRSSACLLRQADPFPALPGKHGEHLCYTTPRDIIGVFDALAQAEWFDRTEFNEKECARLVLLVRSGGIDSAEALMQACEPRARRRFSRRLPL